MREIEEAFLNAVARHEMIRPGDRVLAAVSGGADSVLLLHLLAAHRARCPFTLQAAHLNHGLRGAESDEDEAFVKALAARLALPLAVGRADLTRRPGDPSSVEERARDARRAFLRETALAASCGRIALGHTLDDQAETILMWMLRGAGRGGLSGMEPATSEGIIRPLIGLRRRQVRRCLASIGEEYRDDTTNEDMERLRNRIRRRLVSVLDAEFPGSIETMAAEASLLATEDSHLDAEAAALVPAPGEPLTAATLAAAPPAIARRAVRMAARRAGMEPLSLGRHHIDGILALMGPSMDGKGVDLPGRHRAERRGGAVIFTRTEHEKGRNR